MEEQNNNNNNSGGGFFNGFKKEGNGSGSGNTGQEGSFKDEKKELTDYENIFSNEKKKRQGGDLASVGPETEYTIPEKLEEKNEKPAAVVQASAKKEEKSNQAAKKESVKEHLVSTAKKWKAPSILKTNLIKGEITTFIDWKKNINTLAVDLALSFFILGAVYFGLAFWELSAVEQSRTLGSEISNLNLKIMAIEKEVKTVDIFQAKLKSAKLLLDDHVYWSNIFSLLEKNLLKEVVLTGNFAADLSGEFNFSAQADSFNTIAKQVKLFRANKDILEVEASGGTFAQVENKEGGKKTVVDFKFSIKIDPEIFKNSL